MSSVLELRHLTTLQAIDEAGSLVEAAERLHVTQSALSHQLKDLEHRLGVALIVRRTRPIRFTTAGGRLLALARQVLPQVKRTETELRRLAAGQSGRLHIAIECHSCFQWLMPALDRFREAWPEVELDLSAAFSFTPQAALVRGDLDMVITSDPVDNDAVRYLPLFRYELVLAVARQSALAGARAVAPRALAEETLITYPVEHERLDVFTAFLDPAGVAPAALRTAEKVFRIAVLKELKSPKPTSITLSRRWRSSSKKHDADSTSNSHMSTAVARGRSFIRAGPPPILRNVKSSMMHHSLLGYEGPSSTINSRQPPRKTGKHASDSAMRS